MPASLLSRSPYAALSGRVAWRTADGCVLALPVGARPGFGGAGSVHRAVRPWRFRERRRLAALARMLAGAQRIGRLRAPGGAPVYWVFRGWYGGRGWDVVARPTGPGRADIVTVRRAGVVQGRGRRPFFRRRRRRWGRRETEMVFPTDLPAARHGHHKLRVRGGRAIVTWSRHPLASLANVKTPGDVYVITRTVPLPGGLRIDVPFRVGETGSTRTPRMSTRVAILREFGIPVDDYAVYAGTVQALPGLTVKRKGSSQLDPYSAADPAHRQLLREDVEQTLIRALVPRHPLTNDLKTELWVAPAGIELRFVNPPAFLPGVRVGPLPGAVMGKLPGQARPLTGASGFSLAGGQKFELAGAGA